MTSWESPYALADYYVMHRKHREVRTMTVIRYNVPQTLSMYCAMYRFKYDIFPLYPTQLSVQIRELYFRDSIGGCQDYVPVS